MKHISDYDLTQGRRLRSASAAEQAAVDPSKPHPATADWYVWARNNAGALIEKIDQLERSIDSLVSSRDMWRNIAFDRSTSAAEHERLRIFAEYLAHRGLPADMTPTRMFSQDVHENETWWHGYLESISEIVKAQARAAIEGDPAPTELRITGTRP